MSSELPSQPERTDEPVEATVVDEVNPFGPHLPEMQPFRPHREMTVAEMIGLGFDWSPKAEYVVPQRFGMSAILGIMTALSLLFGGLYWAEAWPVFYAFTSTQVLIVCLVQMFYGRTPRSASAIAGAVLAPLFMLLAAWFTEDEIPVEAVLCLMFVLVPFGAFLGYLTGTCAAGVFLVMDKLEPYLQGRGRVA